MTSPHPAAPRGAATLQELAPRFQAAYDARRYDQARKHLEAMIALAPGQTNLKFALAQLLYKRLRQPEAALAQLHAILATEPARPDIHEFLSSIHLHMGDKDGAVEHALAGLALDPTQAVCYQNILRVRPAMGAALEPRIHDALAASATPAARHPFLHASLGRIYDDAGDYARAFHHFTQANRLRRSRFDLDSVEFLLKEAQGFFTRELFQAHRHCGASDARMVFIVGLPRSGSTLLEQVIAAHPDASSAGERHDMATTNTELAARHQELHGADPNGFRHLAHLTPAAARKAAKSYLARIAGAVADPTAARWIDKMPGNFAQIGLISLLLPNARILHTRRDPLDVALSCYMQVFDEAHPYSEDLMIFAHFAIVYMEFMKLWRETRGERIVDVDYERLASDLPAEAPRLLDHLGLPWNEACARPHENRGLVMTASAAQVRAPVYTSSIGRWKNYAEQLAPLAEVLRRYEAIQAETAAA